MSPSSSSSLRSSNTEYECLLSPEGCRAPVPRTELARGPRARGLDELFKFGLPKLGALGLLAPVMAPMELWRNEGDGSPMGVKEGAEDGGGGPAGVVDGWSPKAKGEPPPPPLPAPRRFCCGVAGELDSGTLNMAVFGMLFGSKFQIKRGQELRTLELTRLCGVASEFRTN